MFLHLGWGGRRMSQEFAERFGTGLHMIMVYYCNSNITMEYIALT